MSSFPTDRPWAAEPGMPAAVAATVVGLVFSCFGIVGAALGAIAVLLILRHASNGAGLKQVLSKTPLSRRLVWMSVLIGVTQAAVLPFVTLLWRRFLAHIGIDAPDQTIAVEVVASSGWKLALLLVSTLLVAPLLEELIFRRLLYGMLLEKCGHFTALVVVSVLFSVIHGSLVAAPALVMLGAVLAFWYCGEGNILAPMLTHATYNVATVVMLRVLGG